MALRPLFLVGGTVLAGGLAAGAWGISTLVKSVPRQDSGDDGSDVEDSGTTNAGTTYSSCGTDDTLFSTLGATPGTVPVNTNCDHKTPR